MITVNKDKLALVKASAVRAQRDKLLSACDWAMMPDAPTDKAIWGAYRQALRDVTEQKGFPDNVIIPKSPQ